MRQRRYPDKFPWMSNRKPLLLLHLSAGGGVDQLLKLLPLHLVLPALVLLHPPGQRCLQVDRPELVDDPLKVGRDVNPINFFPMACGAAEETFLLDLLHLEGGFLF